MPAVGRLWPSDYDDYDRVIILDATLLLLPGHEDDSGGDDDGDPDDDDNSNLDFQF